METRDRTLAGARRPRTSSVSSPFRSLALLGFVWLAFRSAGIDLAPFFECIGLHPFLLELGRTAFDNTIRIVPLAANAQFKIRIAEEGARREIRKGIVLVEISFGQFLLELRRIGLGRFAAILLDRICVAQRSKITAGTGTLFQAAAILIGQLLVLLLRIAIELGESAPSLKSAIRSRITPS